MCFYWGILISESILVIITCLKGFNSGWKHPQTCACYFWDGLVVLLSCFLKNNSV